MAQSRQASFTEALTNVLVGLALALSTQMALYPAFGIRLGFLENLKIALIGTLRHAANLRTCGPRDAISVVIGQRARRNEIFRGNFPLPGYGGAARTETTDPQEPPTVLILRTTKADVDAVANGSLTPEQFASKVQTLKSWTNPRLLPVGTGAGGGFGIPLQSR